MAVEENRLHRQRAPIAIAAMGGALLAAALKLVSLLVAILLGVLLVFLTRCITPEEAYREVEWKALILIGSLLALGSAITHTGRLIFWPGKSWPCSETGIPSGCFPPFLA